MYVNLNYFDFSAFNLERRGTEILKQILPFSEEEDERLGANENYQVLGKHKSRKLFYFAQQKSSLRTAC